MTSPHDLRQFATQAMRDARDYRHDASQCTGDRRARLLKFAAQREDDALFYDAKADRDEQWFAEQFNEDEMLEAAE